MLNWLRPARKPGSKLKLNNLEKSMKPNHDERYESLQITVNHWVPARIVLQQFFDAHPELGLSYSENTYHNFTRRHAKRLQERGVLRRSFSRAAYIADVRRFDAEAYELVSSGLSPSVAAKS
jgi:hypothetical protein